MAKIIFISHPYKAPKHIKGNTCGWNLTTHHWRKLLFSKDSYFIDKLGNKAQKGDITFIGEWECCSECTDCKTNNKLFSKLHKPFTTTLDNYPNILSTAPFVFGPKFYYSCCKIEKSANMAPGDIIIFGSYKNNLPHKIIIDTVMVLSEKIPLLEKQEHQFPYGYTHVTLSRLHPDSTIWKGLMYDEHSGNDNNDTTTPIFSFVPCLLDKNISSTNIPCIIDNTFFGYTIKGNQNTKAIDIKDEDIQKVFNEIASRVIAAGFYLGVRMPTPTNREIYNILK